MEFIIIVKHYLLLPLATRSQTLLKFARAPMPPKIMNLQTAKNFVEQDNVAYGFAVDSLPDRVVEPMVMQGMKIDRIERGRVVCSFTVPSRLVNSGNSLHGGATAALVDIIGSAVILTMGALTTGDSVQISVSYLNGASIGEEVEIESKALRVGKALAVVSVDLRSKKTGKLLAQGRHTKYLALPSKL